MSQAELKAFEEKMSKSLHSLETEYDTIRVGRANPHVLDRITVDYYGTPTPINQIGNISIPEARLLQIQPWEANMVKEVEKAILSSDIGINPNTDGKVIRLVFPELTEERRKELTKEVKKKGESAKVAMRNIRRDALDQFKKMKKDNEITEDDLADLEKEVQKLTDNFVAQIDTRIENKTKEVLSI